MQTAPRRGLLSGDKPVTTAGLSVHSKCPRLQLRSDSLQVAPARNMRRGAQFLCGKTDYGQLKSVERPAIIKAISEARQHGDLSENAEYHSAREKQSFIEGRIKEIEGILGLSEVIDPSKLSGAIKFGAKVTLVDEDTDEEKTWQIVGEHEANIEKGLLNIKSPIARALIGKDEGDSVEVRTPGGEKSYEVLKIEYS